jgi:hypothetical protein
MSTISVESESKALMAYLEACLAFSATTTPRGTYCMCTKTEDNYPERPSIAARSALFRLMTNVHASMSDAAVLSVVELDQRYHGSATPHGLFHQEYPEDCQVASEGSDLNRCKTTDIAQIDTCWIRCMSSFNQMFNLFRILVECNSDMEWWICTMPCISDDYSSL